MQDILMYDTPPTERPRVAEFFAGMGLIRAGLEQAGYQVVWANDFDSKKGQLYRAIYGADDFVEGDIHEIRPESVPDVDLVTASFPCTDMSLAGNRKGLKGSQSGTILRFLEILAALKDQGRLPRQVMLENVMGFLSSHGGRDYETVVTELENLGYNVAPPIRADASTFAGQSRPRIFVVGDTECIPHVKTPTGPGRNLRSVVARLAPDDQLWWSSDRQQRFLEQVSDRHKALLDKLAGTPGIHWRTAYRRVRDGAPRWEIRSDEIAGCLRALRGGSSKQALVEIDGPEWRVRWMTAEEYCLLQGFTSYEKISHLPDHQIQFAAGDAVCVPVVAAIGEQLVPKLETVTAK